jgi:hypothetical protein
MKLPGEGKNFPFPAKVTNRPFFCNYFLFFFVFCFDHFGKNVLTIICFWVLLVSNAIELFTYSRYLRVLSFYRCWLIKYSHYTLAITQTATFFEINYFSLVSKTACGSCKLFYFSVYESWLWINTIWLNFILQYCYWGYLLFVLIFILSLLSS